MFTYGNNKIPVNYAFKSAYHDDILQYCIELSHNYDLVWLSYQKFYCHMPPSNNSWKEILYCFGNCKNCTNEF